MNPKKEKGPREREPEGETFVFPCFFFLFYSKGGSADENWLKATISFYLCLSLPLQIPVAEPQRKGGRRADAFSIFGFKGTHKAQGRGGKVSAFFLPVFFFFWKRLMNGPTIGW